MTIARKTEAIDIVYCGLFVALITAGAFMRVPVPVVPFTLQFLFTNLAGLLLGRRLGFLSCAVYVGAGLAGIPVFVEGGGIAYVLQPTFGYLLGFVGGAWLSGLIARGQTKQPTFNRLLAAGFANLAVVYAAGMVWYYFIANYYMASPIGLWSLFLYCFILAVPGDIILCFVGATVAKRLITVFPLGGRS